MPRQRLAVPSPVTDDMTFEEDCFLRGEPLNTWIYRPVKQLRPLDMRSVPDYTPPDLPFPENARYERDPIEQQGAWNVGGIVGALLVLVAALGMAWLIGGLGWEVVGFVWRRMKG